jgi:hypothetical protein
MVDAKADDVGIIPNPRKTQLGLEVTCMTISEAKPSSPVGHSAATTLLFAAIGFAIGFLFSFAVASYSLYSCTMIM